MQAAVRMDGVVVLEPFGQALEDGHGVWPWVHADAVALGAADGREAGDEVQGGGEVDGFADGVGEAVVDEPLDRLWGAWCAEAVLDAVEHHVADHLAADAAGGGAGPGHDLAVVGVEGEGQGRSATGPSERPNRTTSPFQQGMSKPSEAQRWLEAGATTVPSWARMARRPVCGCRSREERRMRRKTRLWVSVACPSCAARG